MGVALREVFAEFGIEFDRGGELKKGNKVVNRATKNLRKLERQTDRNTESNKEMARSTRSSSRALEQLSSVIGGAAVLGGLRELVNSTVESANEIFLWSGRLGLSQEDMYGWIQTASLFGGSVDDITDVLKELQLKTRDAMTGTESMVEAFQLIGISVDELRPIMNDQNALMDRFMRGLSATNDEATRNFVIDELLSDAGTRLNTMFSAGSEEVGRLRRQFAEAGGQDVPALTKQTRLYTLAQRSLNVEWTQARNALMVKLLPVLTRGLGKVQEWLVATKAWVSESENMRAALFVLGAAAVAAGIAASTAWGPAILGMALVAAKVVLVGLLLEDLYVTAQGGKSMTRMFLDWALGAERANTVIETLMDTVRALGNLGEWVGDTLYDLFHPDREPDAQQRGIRRGEGVIVSSRELEERIVRQTERQAAGKTTLGRGGIVPLAPDELATGQTRLGGRSEQWEFVPGGPGAGGPTENNINIDSPTTVSITVNGAQNPQEVERIARRGIREELRQHDSDLARNLETLVSNNERTTQGEA